MPSSRGVRVAQAEDTRTKLIRSARTLFARQGFHATASAEIVAAAGVTRGALQHHFARKEDLFLAVFEAVETDLMARAAANAHNASGKDLWAAFRNSLGAFLEAATQPDVQRILLIDGPAVLGWEQWRKLEADHGMASIKAAVEAAFADGLIRPAPVEALAHLIMALIHESALMVAHSKKPKKTRADAEQALDALFSNMSK
ncbi:MAG: TetR/AcrR family transcriptional regulator [Spongiibacteraceae bacterium]